MASQTPVPVSDQVKQLDQARLLVLQDAVYWPQILRGILPIISGNLVELRRWGAAFLAETFSTPMLSAETKQELARECLDTLVLLVGMDECEILKSVAQCSASIYPLVFRTICKSPQEIELWQKMGYIKQRLLTLWDTASVGVKICCIKFAQRVIQVQTPGSTDPRLVDRSDISLSLMPSSHPMGILTELQAEGQALLDRLMGAFHESPPDPIMINATLNSVSVLIKTRASVANQIVNGILQFNPFALPSDNLQDKMMARCMEKTIRILLLNLYRSQPNGPFTRRIQEHLGRLQQAKAVAAAQEAESRKRALSGPQNEPAKRAKVTEVVAAPLAVPTPPPPPPPVTGPMTLGEVFTLTPDAALSTFDAQQLPLDMVIKITIAALYSVNQQVLEQSVATVKERLVAVANLPIQKDEPSPTAEQKAEAEDEEEPYDPESRVRTPSAEPEASQAIVPPTEMQLGLPLPDVLNPEECAEAEKECFNGLIEKSNAFESKSSLVSRKHKVGLDRVAASTMDREGFFTILTRIATRALDFPGQIKTEDGFVQPIEASLANREALLNYVTLDWRSRLDLIVAWLNEEWYNDRVLAETEEGRTREPQYPVWMRKVLNAIFPYLEVKDRTFMRILSEIPELDEGVFRSVKGLCVDPDRAALGVSILQYLMLFKPPVKHLCQDLLLDLWDNNPEIKPLLQRLQKFLPKNRIENGTAETPPVKTEDVVIVKKEEPEAAVAAS